MCLVKGISSLDPLLSHDHSEAWIFKKVFGANWKKGLVLHSLLTLAPSDLVEGIAHSSNRGHTSEELGPKIDIISVRCSRS